MPKGEKRYPKTDEAKRLFMASPELTWIGFCKEQGWNPRAVRNKYPVPKWIAEKVQKHSEEFGAEVQGMMSEQSELWYRECAKTLREYPKMADAVAQVVRYRTQQMLRTIQKDQDEGTDAFKKVPTVEVRQLATAMKAVTDAKYGSLMLSAVKIKEFEQPAEESTGGKIVFEIEGGGDAKNISKIMEEWHNK